MSNYGIYVNNKVRSSSVRVFVRENNHYYYCGSYYPTYTKTPTSGYWSKNCDLTLGAPLVMAVWDD